MDDHGLDEDKLEKAANDLLTRAVETGLTESDTIKLRESLEALSLLSEMRALSAILGATETIEREDGSLVSIVSEQALLEFARSLVDLPGGEAAARLPGILGRMDATRRQTDNGVWVWEIPLGHDDR